MGKKTNKPIGLPRLRLWTKETLQAEDYAFAVSEDRKEWKSPSHTWHRRIVLECLAWEIEREFSGCEKQPFVTACRGSIEEIERHRKPSPSSLPALNEFTDLGKAIDAVKQQPGFPFSTFHVLEIEHGDDTGVTVQRFQNWLIVRFGIQGRAPGRKDKHRALLRALAVRRLRKAGYTRRNAAVVALRMNERLLGRDQWKDLPKKAEAAISERHQQMREWTNLGFTKKELLSYLPGYFRVE
jgi:hypothetical protein